MANPPFNVNGVDKDKLAGDPRFPFGLPKTDNGNYLWIQQFYSALNDTGRAGFVMANSAGDAGHSEREIRRQLIESGSVDVMVAIGTNFFYTVTLPVTLWFLDKAKAGTDREDTVLFIDARHLFRQIDRAHRDFLPEQIELLANIVRLYRGEDVETIDGSDAAAQGALPRRHLRRRPRALQGRDPSRDRSPGLEPQPRPLHRHRRGRGRRRGLHREARGALRGVHPAQRRGRRAPSQGRRRHHRDPRRMTEWREVDARRRLCASVRVSTLKRRAASGDARRSRESTSRRPLDRRRRHGRRRARSTYSIGRRRPRCSRPDASGDDRSRRRSASVHRRGRSGALTDHALRSATARLDPRFIGLRPARAPIRYQPAACACGADDAGHCSTAITTIELCAFELPADSPTSGRIADDPRLRSTT